MKRDGFFSKLKNNIYNIEKFSEYVRDGLGKAILYALILSLIIGGIQGVYMGFRAKNNINEGIVELNEPKYDFSIKNGILEMKNSPVKFNQDNIVVYIDSNKDLNQAEGLKDAYVHGDMYILLLKDGIKVGSGGLNKDILYKDAFTGEYTNKTIVEQLKLASVVIVPITVGFTIFQYFTTYLLNCLIIAAFSIIIGMIMGLKMKASAMYSLSVYAATLPSLILLPFSLIRPDIYFDTAFMAGTIIYVAFILRYIKKDLLKKIKL